MGSEFFPELHAMLTDWETWKKEHQIKDWETWKKEHHVYIPTAEEIENAKKQGSVKVRRLRENIETVRKLTDEYRKKIKNMKEQICNDR